MDHCSDVTAFENPAFALRCLLDRNIHHGASQVVRPNDLVREQQPKRGVDRAQQAIAEIGFLARFDRVDVRRPEDVMKASTAGQKRLVDASGVADMARPAQ
jgi:hypothetical protein